MFMLRLVYDWLLYYTNINIFYDKYFGDRENRSIYFSITVERGHQP